MVRSDIRGIYTKSLRIFDGNSVRAFKFFLFFLMKHFVKMLNKFRLYLEILFLYYFNEESHRELVLNEWLRAKLLKASKSLKLYYFDNFKNSRFTYQKNNLLLSNEKFITKPLVFINFLSFKYVNFVKFRAYNSLLSNRLGVYLRYLLKTRARVNSNLARYHAHHLLDSLRREVAVEDYRDRLMRDVASYVADWKVNLVELMAQHTGKYRLGYARNIKRVLEKFTVVILYLFETFTSVLAPLGEMEFRQFFYVFFGKFLTASNYTPFLYLTSKDIKNFCITFLDFFVKDEDRRVWSTKIKR